LENADNPFGGRPRMNLFLMIPQLDEDNVSDFSTEEATLISITRLV